MSILTVKKPHWPSPAHPGKSSVVQEEPAHYPSGLVEPSRCHCPCTPSPALQTTPGPGRTPENWLRPSQLGCPACPKLQAFPQTKGRKKWAAGETGPPRTLCPGGHIRPQVPGLGGGGEARSPETWMVCCLSSPGLPARVPGPPSPPSPRVKPILPNPKGRQAGLCFSEPNMLRWTDRHPVSDCPSPRCQAICARVSRPRQ